jgi:hypothetical protein
VAKSVHLIPLGSPMMAPPRWTIRFPPPPPPHLCRFNTSPWLTTNRPPSWPRLRSPPDPDPSPQDWIMDPICEWQTLVRFWFLLFCLADLNPAQRPPTRQRPPHRLVPLAKSRPSASPLHLDQRREGQSSIVLHVIHVQIGLCDVFTIAKVSPLTFHHLITSACPGCPCLHNHLYHHDICIRYS